MEFHKIWIDQCEAARGIEVEFGTQRALEYLIEEKFINYLEAAERDSDFRQEIPAFVAEIKSIFETWQLAECLERARLRPPLSTRPITKTTSPMTNRISSLNVRWTFIGVPPSCSW
jgi:hypothetical protein